eukprot:2500569-Prymnesium_polylepis.1
MWVGAGHSGCSSCGRGAIAARVGVWSSRLEFEWGAAASHLGTWGSAWIDRTGVESRPARPTSVQWLGHS